MKNPVCDKLLRHAPVPLLAALMRCWGAAGLGWMLDSWAAGKAAGMLADSSNLDINAVNKQGETALMLAAHEGYTGLVVNLLGRPDLDVNLVDIEKGWTALMSAAEKGHHAAVKALLGRPEVDINVVSKGGNSALMLAAG